jgi:hypothetical protein
MAVRLFPKVHSAKSLRVLPERDSFSSPLCVGPTEVCQTVRLNVWAVLKGIDPTTAMITMTTTLHE